MFATYQPGNSPLHRLPAGVKVLLVCALILAVSLSVREAWHVVPALGFAASLYAVGRIRPRAAWDQVRPVLPMLIAILVLQWIVADLDPALRGPARQFLDGIGLGGRADEPAANLSHGEQRQLEIAMALATRPSLLLLDEPMAGMGRDESAKMVNLLRDLKGRHTIILIEHDMDAVFALADRITVLVYGRAIATGAPGDIRANDEVRAAYLGTEAAQEVRDA